MAVKKLDPYFFTIRAYLNRLLQRLKVFFVHASIDEEKINRAGSLNDITNDNE